MEGKRRSVNPYRQAVASTTGRLAHRQSAGGIPHGCRPMPHETSRLAPPQHGLDGGRANFDQPLRDIAAVAMVCRCRWIRQRGDSRSVRHCGYLHPNQCGRHIPSPAGRARHDPTPVRVARIAHYGRARIQKGAARAAREQSQCRRSCWLHRGPTGGWRSCPPHPRQPMDHSSTACSWRKIRTRSDRTVIHIRSNNRMILLS